MTRQSGKCGLKERMDDFLLSQPRTYKGWLIGDSGYGLRPNMMVPYLNPSSANITKNVAAQSKER